MVLVIYAKLKPIGFILFSSLLFFACGLSVFDVKCYGGTLGFHITPKWTKPKPDIGFVLHVE